MKKNLVILDEDSIYATRLMEFMKKRKNFDFDLFIFTSPERMDHFIKDNAVHILLLDQRFHLEEQYQEQVDDIFILSEIPNSEHKKGYPLIFRYQRAEAIISDILLYYNQLAMEGERNGSNRNIKIITIFPLIQDQRKTEYGWSLASKLAEEYKTLYIPLELFSESKFIVQRDHNPSLSQWIYYLKGDDGNLSSKLNALLQFEGNLEYIAGVTHGMDLLSIEEEDLKLWIKELREHTNYERVVFYVGFYSELIETFIRESHSFYIPIYDLEFDDVLYREWERQMDMVERESHTCNYEKIVLDKTEK